MKKSKSLFLVTVLVYIFLIGPLLVIMAASFSDTTYLKFPGEGFTLKWYAQILKVKTFGSAAKYSIIIAFAAPYVMRVVTSSLANFDFSMEEAARILGAGNVYTFFHILLPNIKSGIVSACIMAIINSFNNVSLSAFLTSAGVTVLPIEMMAYVEYHFDPTIAALASLLMVITLGVMLVIEKTLGLKSVV